jgi:hypothetical protein
MELPAVEKSMTPDEGEKGRRKGSILTRPIGFKEPMTLLLVPVPVLVGLMPVAILLGLQALIAGAPWLGMGLCALLALTGIVRFVAGPGHAATGAGEEGGADGGDAGGCGCGGCGG